MGYCALLIPQTVQSSKENKQGFIESLTGKLTSCLKSGGLNFTNATTLLKNTASLLSESSDTIANKFSGIALTQLLVDGKMTNQTAIDYLKQIGYHGSGQITKVFELSDKKGFTEAALNLFRNIGNIFFKMLSLSLKTNGANRVFLCKKEIFVLFKIAFYDCDLCFRGIMFILHAG